MPNFKGLFEVISDWIESHHTWASDERDFCGHMCVKWGKTKHIYVFLPDYPESAQEVPGDKFDDVFKQTSWLNALEVLNDGN
jgi:hypothetical protein